jgi:hypothetical protein
MSHVVRSKAEKEVALTNALVRLGSARRERLTTEDMKVYADGLRPWPLEAVVAVCEDFARAPVEEFGPRFPTLGSVLQGVKDHLKREQIRKEQATVRLPEGRMVNPPKVAELRQRFEQLVRAKSMPALEREPGCDDQ